MWRAAEGSPARHARGAERLTALALLLSAALLGLGVTLPVVKVSTLFVFTDHVSILDGIATLLREGEVVLAVLVAAFSVVFPAVKILTASYVWRGCNAGAARSMRALAVLGWVGRWSMLDVLVVALVVFSVKASSVADATVEPGLYCFAAAVLTTAVALALLKRASARATPAPTASSAPAVDMPPSMQ